MSEQHDTDFAAALRASVSARGLSLERVRALLAEHGVSLSVATLSYWQTGRSRPERASSLGAIGPLETVLGVPRGFLAGRVDFRRGQEPEFVASTYAPSGVHEVLDDDWQVLLAAFARLDLSPDDGLARVSIHDRLQLRGDGTQASHEVRVMLLAQRDGVDRFPIWYDQPEYGVGPVIVPEMNCRLGRVVEFPERSAVAAEVILDRPLRQGSTAVVQYRLDSGSGPFASCSGNHQGGSSHSVAAPAKATLAERPDHFSRAVLGRVRELAVEVSFGSQNLPASAEQVCVLGGVETVRAMHVADPLLLVDLDAGPGQHGLRWTW